MPWTNFHSHCDYGVGTDSADQYVLAAMEQEVRILGFSALAPLPFPDHQGMDRDRLASYTAEIERLKLRFQGEVEIACGLEIDYVPGISWSEYLKPHIHHLDYTIGAVHHVHQFPDGRLWQIDGSLEAFEEGLETIFQGDVQAAVRRYYELVRWMVMLENPDIVSHLDKIRMHNGGNRFFDVQAPWYQSEVEKTLRVIANIGAVLEVNTRGLYTGESLEPYPDQWILERARALDIPVTLSSDAHQPNEVAAGFRFGAKILRKAGYGRLTVLSQGTWRHVRLTESGVSLPWLDRHDQGSSQPA